MGVSAGAIYKWEQAISTPDITLIAELASFFGVSLDTLVGYQMCGSDRDRILADLKKIRLEKSYENRWEEVEIWLHRYPNDFDVIYAGGVLYNLAGIETENRQHLYRSIELLKHACALIGQNHDSKLSETAIRQDIAVAYLVMGEKDKGLEQLKKHNPCGVNDDILGCELAADPQRQKEAIPYLTNVLTHCTASLYRMVIGFVNLFFAQNDYRSAIEILEWMIGYLDGLKTEKGTSYLDKNNALLLSLCGAAYERIGKMDEARKCLRKARSIAMEFDAAPNYTNQNVRYCENAEPRAAYDNIGSTAMNTILNILQEGMESSEEPILALWEEICNEE